MAQWIGHTMSIQDPFAEIARFYDPIMNHVDYQRWRAILDVLTPVLPRHVRHLDAACGTGTLLESMRRDGWLSMGIDISHAMLQAGRKRRGALPMSVADLRALPFQNAFDCITCLFDSINFLLESAEIEGALQEFHTALDAQGFLYFDIVTERMVTEHFEGKSWTEQNGGFSTTWSSSYDRSHCIANTRIRINSGIESLVRERIYPADFFKEALAKAGFTLLAMVDAHTFRTPGKRTTRIDFFAAKAPRDHTTKHFKEILERLQDKGV